MFMKQLQPNNLRDYENIKQPKQDNRNGAVPFFWFVAFPHLFRLLFALRKDLLWDVVHDDGNQERHDEQILQQAKNGYEVGNQINGRKRRITLGGFVFRGQRKTFLED